MAQNIRNYIKSADLPVHTLITLNDATANPVDEGQLEMLINHLPMGESVRNDLNILWATEYDMDYA